MYMYFLPRISRITKMSDYIFICSLLPFKAPLFPMYRKQENLKVLGEAGVDEELFDSVAT